MRCVDDSDSDYGAEFALAPASKVRDGQVKHNDTAVRWFDSAEQARTARDRYATSDPGGKLVVVRRAWTLQ